MKQDKWIFFQTCAAALLLMIAFAGCSPRRAKPAPDSLTWLDLLKREYRLEMFPRLDQPGAALISSYDRTGGNQDYNQGFSSGPNGWVVLADLAGPGYVSRFWCTGVSNAQHRFRFYFDNERNCAMDLSLEELCGGKAPFLQPFAANENYCWFNLVPMPYKRRLIIMAQDPLVGRKDPRFFFQINYNNLPAGSSVASMHGYFTANELAAFETAKAEILAEQYWQAPDLTGALCATQTFALAAGEAVAMPRITGPGIIKRLSVRPDFSSIPVHERDRALRDIVLSLAWDDEAKPSVAVPLGDFFGSVWRRTQFRSLVFGWINAEWLCRFPMPFARAAALRIENQGNFPFKADVRLDFEALPEWDSSLGYFHAAWDWSGPDQIGRPHVILRTAGRGKYVGCLFAAWSLDRTFWLLEGDEIMFVDGKTSPFWHGTGLEDYFNGGWYYQNILARPLHGLTHKTFFRTVQYRLHQADPVKFNSSIEAFMERGPDNASHGWMESAAFYYLARPAPAPSRLDLPAVRQPPTDELAAINIMIEFLNCERFGDYQEAIELIDAFLPRAPNPAVAAVLRLRRLAYLEEQQGFEAIKPQYEAFMTDSANAAAIEQARLLLWRRDAADRALFGLYANTHTRAFLDGKEIAQAGAPERMTVIGVALPPGEHVLALQFRYHPYPDWVQASLQFPDQEILTNPDWVMAFNPTGNWTTLDYDDGAWRRIGEIGAKGPPEEPYIFVEPNAFINMQSRAIALRPTSDWPEDKSGFCVFRRRFVTRPNTRTASELEMK